MQMVNENRPIKPQSQLLFKPPIRPRISNLDTFSQEKLFKIIGSDNSSSAAFQCLTELMRRTLVRNQELVEKVFTLEQEVTDLKATLNPPKKKCGRKAEEFFVNGKTLDDDYLVYLIDDGLYKIRELEKEVGANKNQLRRRYERCKERREGGITYAVCKTYGTRFLDTTKLHFLTRSHQKLLAGSLTR